MFLEDTPCLSDLSFEFHPHSLILFVLFNAWDQSKPCGKPMGSFGETSGFLTGTHRFPPLEPPFYPIRTTHYLYPKEVEG